MTLRLAPTYTRAMYRYYCLTLDDGTAKFFRRLKGDGYGELEVLEHRDEVSSSALSHFNIGSERS